jgi:NADPH-dependent curcumin reductase CurA
MRGRMNDVKSYAPPLRIGEVMGSGSVGKVINSQNSQCKEKTRASNWCA